MLGRTAVALALLGSNLLAGCSAHHARTAGGTIGLLGGATTIVGIAVAAGCEPFPDDEETTCQTDSVEPDPVNGLRVMGVGLFLVGVGALIYATAAEDSKTRAAGSSTEPEGEVEVVEAEKESEGESEPVNPDPALNWD